MMRHQGAGQTAGWRFGYQTGYNCCEQNSGIHHALDIANPGTGCHGFRCRSFDFRIVEHDEGRQFQPLAKADAIAGDYAGGGGGAGCCRIVFFEMNLHRLTNSR